MTTFVTDVPLQIWSDPEMIFRLENILPYNDQENIYDVNSQFQVCKPTSLLQGTLKHVVVDLGKEWMASRDGEPAAADIAYEVVNDMNGMQKCENVQVGQTYSYTHTYPADKWYPMGNFSDPRSMAQLKDKIDRSELPRSQTGPSFNYVTMLNDNFTHDAQPFMCKIDGIHDDNGVIQMRARIRVEYFTEIEYKTDPHMKFKSLNMGNRFAILAQRGIKNIYDQLRPSNTEYHYLTPNQLWAHGRFEYMEDINAERNVTTDDDIAIRSVANPKSFSDKDKFTQNILKKLDIRTKENTMGEVEMTDYHAPETFEELVDSMSHDKDKVVRQTINDLQATDSVPGVHVVQARPNTARVLTEDVESGSSKEKTMRKSLGVIADMTNRMNYDKELEQLAEEYMQSMNAEYDTTVSTKDLVKMLKRTLIKLFYKHNHLRVILMVRNIISSVNINDPLTGTSKRQRLALDEKTNLGEPYDYGTINIHPDVGTFTHNLPSFTAWANNPKAWRGDVTKTQIMDMLNRGVNLYLNRVILNTLLVKHLKIQLQNKNSHYQPQ